PVLAFGWVDFPHSLPPFSANFVLWIAGVYFVRRRFGTAAVLGVVATLLGLTTLTSYKNEGRHVGYFCWQSSQIVLAVGATMAWWIQRKDTAAQESTASAA